MVVSGPWGPGNMQQWREWTFPDLSFDDMVPMICKSLRGKPVGPWVSVAHESWDAEPYVHPPMREEGYDPGDEDYTQLAAGGWDAGCEYGLRAGWKAGREKGYEEGLTRGLQKGKAKGKGFAHSVDMEEAFRNGFDKGFFKGIREGKGKGSREGKGKGKSKGKKQRAVVLVTCAQKQQG